MGQARSVKRLPLLAAAHRRLAFEKPLHHPKLPLTAPTPSTSTSCLRNPSGPRYDPHAASLELLTDPPQRQALVRVARQQPAFVARRTFITPTAVRSGDSSQSLEYRQY